MTTRSLAAALALTALLGVACSSDDDSTVSAPAEDESTVSAPTEESASEAEHNDADVEFAKSMIVHHGQAIEMAELAVERAEDEAVRDLAARIEAAQSPEIEQLTAWLESWDEEVPSTGGEAGMDMGSDMDMGGDMDMGESSGMMGPEEMEALESASGAEFDQLFLEMMVVHHEGAVMMAQDEVDEGSFPDAVALAEEIVSTQQAEIDEMNELLSSTAE